MSVAESNDVADALSSPASPSSLPSSRSAPSSQTVELWHQRLGHLNQQSMQQLLKQQAVNGAEELGSSSVQWEMCEGCLLCSNQVLATGRRRAEAVAQSPDGD